MFQKWGKMGGDIWEHWGKYGSVVQPLGKTFAFCFFEGIYEANFSRFIFTSNY